MAVPSVITDLSATAASNSPAGSDPIGTSLDDFLRVIQAFERQLFDTATIWSGTAGGTANALTLTPSPAITAYKVGQSFVFKSGASPSTTAATVAISGLSTIAIQNSGAALAGGEILANQWYRITLDTASTCQLEAVKLQSTPNPFSDAAALVKNSSDATKLIILSAASIATATTRTLTAQDKSYTIADHADVLLRSTIASPTFTGTPAAPTATVGTNTTQLATTAFVAAALGSNATQTTVNSPAAITSTTGKMLGIAGAITPTRSGNILVTVTGSVTMGGADYTIQIYSGTGGAPSNGAAVTGTARGNKSPFIYSGSANIAPNFSITALITGATLSTALWLDLDAYATSGALTFANICLTAVEV